MAAAHEPGSQMVSWLDYTDLESPGMKCLNDNNRKQIKSPKKEIRRNGKQTDWQRKMKGENLQSDTKAEPAFKLLLAVEQRFRLLGPQGQESSLTASEPHPAF